ncbi:MAG: hypothetical protein ABSA03_22185 [Streptosporangiaceae bacterium]
MAGLGARLGGKPGAWYQRDLAAGDRYDGYTVGVVVWVRPAGVRQIRTPTHVSYCPAFQGG